ncbi:unnamed protein product [Closterium sp. NIES-54]
MKFCPSPTPPPPAATCSHLLFPPIHPPPPCAQHIESGHVCGGPLLRHPQPASGAACLLPWGGAGGARCRQASLHSLHRPTLIPNPAGWPLLPLLISLPSLCHLLPHHPSLLPRASPHPPCAPPPIYTCPAWHGGASPPCACMAWRGPWQSGILAVGRADKVLRLPADSSAGHVPSQGPWSMGQGRGLRGAGQEARSKRRGLLLFVPFNCVLPSSPFCASLLPSVPPHHPLYLPRPLTPTAGAQLQVASKMEVTLSADARALDDTTAGEVLLMAPWQVRCS